MNDFEALAKYKSILVHDMTDTRSRTHHSMAFRWQKFLLHFSG